MLTTRVIPCLLLQNGGLVKTVKFQSPDYVGDPTNAIKIYNDKQVDELVVLDIAATVAKKEPAFGAIEMFASECFMPVAYGGGLRNIGDVQRVFRLGIEKVVLNTYAVERPEFIRELSERFGAQAIVVSIDAKRNAAGGHEVFIRGGRTPTGLDPLALALKMSALGAGEIFLNSIDQDGTMAGYDLELIRNVSSAVEIPVIACGGAGKLADFGRAVKEGGAAAVATGSMVVYFGRNRAVLINFPTKRELDEVLN
ncbi:MAG: imidazole glycerol phosphate synthase subunit HisF [Acidobacteria bacterium]|nr:imidazole glycerol phosphate synthase subunit HisF [Acidobacteriota bacterium]